MTVLSAPRPAAAVQRPEPALRALPQIDPVTRLTPRELEVMSLMAQGLGNSAICARLFITQKTLERHVNSIFGKLDLPVDDARHRRVCAVLTYLRSPLSRGRLVRA